MGPTDDGGAPARRPPRCRPQLPRPLAGSLPRPDPLCERRFAARSDYRRHVRRILLRVVVGLVVLVLLASWGFRVWVGMGVPALSGREALPGLGDSVVVLWDSLAVPS